MKIFCNTSCNTCYNECMKCTICSTPITGKAKTCSTKCRVALSRNKKAQNVTVNDQTVTVESKSVTKEPSVTISEALKPGESFSPSDQERFNKYGDWLNFADETFTRECASCKKEFKTRLRLNRFCALSCRGTIFGKS